MKALVELGDLYASFSDRESARRAEERSVHLSSLPNTLTHTFLVYRIALSFDPNCYQ